MLLGCQHRFNPGAGNIGHISFEISHLSFPETAGFTSVVINLSLMRAEYSTGALRALNCVGASVRLKVKHDRDELGGFRKWQLRIVK